MTRSATGLAQPDTKTGVFEPVRMLEVELSQRLLPITVYREETERPYPRAWVLVRLHTHPLGMVDLHLDKDGLSAEAYADQIWRTLRQAINDHLRQDGLPEVNELGATGLLYSDEPLCVGERYRILTEAPFVSVIVCTRDRAEQLPNCLSALLSLNYPHYEIIVVDNAPKTSATADLIREQHGHVPQVRYVREDRPGLSWARNCGLQRAQGEIVAYTDDDAVVDPHWLTALVRGFRIIENVACVTGLTLSAEIETQPQDWFEQFGGLSKGRGFRRGIFNMTTHWVQNPFLPVPAFGAGVNMAFKTSILRNLGGFDPSLGAGSFACGGEDTAVYSQVILKGYTLVYEPDALVHHFHRRDYAGLRKQLHGYGVSISAFYMWCLFQDPRHIIHLIGILPQALHYFFGPGSTRTSNMKRDYPRELTWIELKGMVRGPFAFLRSYWHLRRTVKQFGPLEME